MTTRQTRSTSRSSSRGRGFGSQESPLFQEVQPITDDVSRFRSRSRSSASRSPSKHNAKTRSSLVAAQLSKYVKEGQFRKTQDSLKQLQDALCCKNHVFNKCHQVDQDCIEQDLFSLGVCEHRFCKTCVEQNKAFSCPVCSMPYRPANVHIDKQLSNIAALCLSLENILTGKHKEEDQQELKSSDCKVPALSREDDVQSTPQNREAEQINPEHAISHGPLIRTTPRGKKRLSQAVSKEYDVQSTPPNQEAEQVNPEHSVSHDSSKNTTPRGKKRLSQNLSPNIKEPQERFKTPKHTPQGQKRVSQGKTKLEAGTIGSAETRRSTPRRNKALSSTSSPKSGLDVNTTSPSIGKNDLPAIPGTRNNRKCKANDHASKGNASSPIKINSDELIIRAAEAQVKSCLTPSAQKKNKSQQRGAGSSSSRGNHATLEKRNAKGETQLQVAAVKADFQKVQELLKLGANPNVKDNAGWTPLHEAVIFGNTKIAELLLDHGAFVNTPGLENDTPLHDAVINQRLECVQLLVKRGANVMARNTHGRTSLDIAKTEDIREALLVSSGVDVVTHEETLMEETVSNDVQLCFIASSLSKEEMVCAQNCSKFLDARVVDSYKPEVTHSINGVNAEGLCPRTLKFLNSVLSGAWIVTTEWVNECLKQEKRVSEEDFEIAGCTTSGKCDAPQRARLNRLKQLPGLFDGCQFFFHGKFQYPTASKEELVNLAKLGGGVILTREPRLYNLDDYPYTVPYHAASSSSLSDCAIFVIYDDACRNPPHVNAQRMSCLPASWFLDSIAAFTLLDKNVYLKH